MDDATVHIVLKYLFAALLSILDSSEGSIISPKAIKELGKDLAKKAVGTGPYKFESWVQGQEMALVKNDSYWGKTGEIEKIIYKSVPEDLTRVAMVEAGEAQVADQVPVTELDRIQKREKDQEKRKEIYAKAQAIELEEVILIPIRTISHLAITSKNTEGVWMNPVGFFIFNDVTVK